MSLSTLVLVLVVLVVGAILWLRRRPAQGNAAQTAKIERASTASPNAAAKPRVTEGEDWIAYKEPIPKGWRTYGGGLEVRGVHVEPYRTAVARFADGSEQHLSLEAEPDNPHDPHAIKVIGQSKTRRGASAFTLGYVPAEVAEALATTGLLSAVSPRLRFMRVREGQTPTVEFYLLIPKDKVTKEQLAVLGRIREDKQANSPITSEQKEYAAFFDLKLPRGAKYGDARATIDQHMAAARTETPERFAEWTAYWNIFEQLDDAEARRDDFGIKAVNRKLLNEAIDSLKAEGMTMAQLPDEIDLVVERLIELHPELERES